MKTVFTDANSDTIGMSINKETNQLELIINNNGEQCSIELNKGTLDQFSTMISYYGVQIDLNSK